MLLILSFSTPPLIVPLFCSPLQQNSLKELSIFPLPHFLLNPLLSSIGPKHSTETAYFKVSNNLHIGIGQLPIFSLDCQHWSPLSSFYLALGIPQPPDSHPSSHHLTICSFSVSFAASSSSPQLLAQRPSTWVSLWTHSLGNCHSVSGSEYLLITNRCIPPSLMITRCTSDIMTNDYQMYISITNDHQMFISISLSSEFLTPYPTFLSTFYLRYKYWAPEQEVEEMSKS